MKYRKLYVIKTYPFKWKFKTWALWTRELSTQFFQWGWWLVSFVWWRKG